MDSHQKALDSIFGDLDDLEQKKMFGKPDGDEGTSITITISPSGEISQDNPGMEKPEDALCEGDEVKMAEGGVVNPEKEEGDDLGLPPFLRKKKKI